MPEKLLKVSYIFWHSVLFYLFYRASRFSIFWGGGILIHLFSVFVSNQWTSTREQKCLLGAWRGLTKPTSGCWRGAALDSLVSISAEVAQVSRLGFPEPGLFRFIPFLESRKAHSWDSKGEGGGGQQCLSALGASFKSELFIQALASAAER